MGGYFFLNWGWGRWGWEDEELREATSVFFVKSGWRHDLSEDGGGWWEWWSLGLEKVIFRQRALSALWKARWTWILEIGFDLQGGMLSSSNVEIDGTIAFFQSWALRAVGKTDKRDRERWWDFGSTVQWRCEWRKWGLERAVRLGETKTGGRNWDEKRMHPRGFQRWS